MENLDTIVTRYLAFLDSIPMPAPGLVCIERPFRDLELCGVWSVLILASFNRACHVQTVHPTHLKGFALGKMSGDKDEIRLEVFKRWKFEHDSNDVVDAYVLAHIARCRGLHDGYTQHQRDLVQRIYEPKKRRSGTKKKRTAKQSGS